MKLNMPELEVVRFLSEDVIATSGNISAPTTYIARDSSGSPLLLADGSYLHECEHVDSNHVLLGTFFMDYSGYYLYNILSAFDAQGYQNDNPTAYEGISSDKYNPADNNGILINKIPAGTWVYRDKTTGFSYTH